MAKRGRRTTFEERVEIGERSDAGQTDPEIASAMDRSVWTVRKWRRRYQREGRAGLVSPMGRPATGALGQFSSEIRDAVRDIREEHSGWGARTILAELEDDPGFVDEELPSRSRVAAFLNQEGYTRKYEGHTEHPQPQDTTAEQPHEEWEMDAQGVIDVPSLGSVSIINIGDLFSRLKVDSYPCLGSSHPNTLDYQFVLRRAFLQYGFPSRISLDRDSVFYDNARASPYPTPLHLWLVALDVEVRFIDQPPPGEHSFIERTHQTVTQQAVEGRAFADDAALQDSLCSRLEFLDTRFPSRSLDDQTPLEAHPEARHSGRPYRPQWEEALLDMQRVYDYLAQERWFRRVSSQGQFSLGGYRYSVGKDLADQTLEVTFDSQTRELVCLSEDGTREIHLSAQGLA